jgi:hypothetical protein
MESTLTYNEFVALIPHIDNPFGFTLEVFESIKNNTITGKEYEVIFGMLKLHCELKDIETKNEICSLY